MKAETESEVEPQEGKKVEPQEEKRKMKERLSGTHATVKGVKEKALKMKRQSEQNEKRLSGMQATEIMHMEFRNEFLKAEKPEFLKAKFKNELEFLKAEQQAQQTVLAKHQQQKQKRKMKGGSSFASKYQLPSVEEECPTAKESSVPLDIVCRQPRCLLPGSRCI